jgi:DNA-binding CsgD family transcriptional regulator
MEHLSNAQLRRALHATQELAELDDLAQLPERAASMLRRLVPCDIGSYNAVDPVSQQASVAADPAESLFEGGVEALAQFAHQNPLVAYYARTGDGRALRISDFISRRQLHRTDLYNLVYRQIALEHQMAIAMPSPQRSLGRPGELIGLTLSRSRRDFNAAEQLLLEHIRPHFAATLARLHELALLRAISCAESESSRWLVLAGRDGVIGWLNAPAARGLNLNVGERLPAPVRDWAAAERVRHDRDRSSGSSDLCTTGLVNKGLQLRARLVPNAYPQLDALHLSPLEELPSPRQLRSLALTPRQADVLALALAGHTSAEIASALTLSPRTVEKHFEAIYCRLGVSNRSQAVSTALRALGAGPNGARAGGLSAPPL